MSIFGKFITGLILVLLLEFCATLQAYDRKPKLATSLYAQKMCQKMGADYTFSCPDTVETGTVEAVNLVIKTGLSSAELNSLIAAESHRFSNVSNARPCLDAHIDLMDTDGIVVEAMTSGHQRILPFGQNQWTWQIKGIKPGDYLLSLTLSLCADENHGDPIATPIAFNHRITVVGEPLPNINMQSGVLLGGVLFVVIGFLAKGFQLLKKRCRDKDCEIHPGVGDKIFVSYSKHDQAKVEPVIALLKEAGHDLWIDRHAIEGAASWREEIVEALTNSRYMLFFASKTSYRSINVGKELSIAADENLIIIPVLLENCEPAGAGKFVVAGLQRIDARNKSAREVASVLSVLLGRKVSNFLKFNRDDSRGGRKSHSSIST